jgi:hypothetical protein
MKFLIITVYVPCVQTGGQAERYVADNCHFVHLFIVCRYYTLYTNTNEVYNSNKSPTRCNNFLVYYCDVYLQLNMFQAFSRPSSEAQ